MCEHERPVGEVEYIELDEVDVELQCPLECSDGVLGLERGCAAMADPQGTPTCTPAKLDQVLRMTTTAQSSVKSPPVNARQSPTIARARSAAGSRPCQASSAASPAAPCAS